MTEFNTIDEKTDTSNLTMSYVDWDVIVNGKPYAVFNFPDYVHTSGGRFGENSYYCCPVSIMKCNKCSNSSNTDIKHEDVDLMKPEGIFRCCKNFKPLGKDLIAFNGEPCNWDVIASSKNYIKHKYNDESVQSRGYEITIKRNGVEFYTFNSRELSYGLSRAQMLLSEIHEHSINFNSRGYEKQFVDRKIFYRGYPAIIKSYHEGCAIIIPDENACNYLLSHDGKRYINGKDNEGDILNADIFSDNIFWWRSDEDTERWIIENRPLKHLLSDGEGDQK